MDRKSEQVSGGHPLSSVDELTLAVVQCLASDEDALHAFVAETGQDPGSLRAGLADRSLQSGLLTYLLRTDGLIRAVADMLGRTPDAIGAAAAKVVARPDEHHF